MTADFKQNAPKRQTVLAFLTLKKLNEQVVAVHLENGEHVGNLKLIGGVWKFKAIGYDAEGRVIPGSGPLTERHNLRFAALDETLISVQLMLK